MTQSVEEQAEPHDEALKAALKELGRAEAAFDKLLAKERKAKAQYKAAENRFKASNLERLKKAMLAALERAKVSSKLRAEASTKVQEAKLMLREQRQLATEAERKERAKERAVAAFVKRWEREYDLEMKRKKKNIKLRKREVRRS